MNDARPRGSGTFSDHFSGHAREYAEARPHYPDALFDRVAALAPARDLAWDCGTGSGQAAVPLAQRFKRVLATDASAEQVARAEAAPGVEYRVAPEDACPTGDATVDLVTVAQALHWFRFDAFYEEVRRVLAPGGALAVWTYDNSRVDPAVDAVLDRYYHERVGRYWPAERRHVERAYVDIPFPFAGGAREEFPMTHAWTRERYVAYVATWSATARAKRLEGVDPLPELERSLDAVWPAGAPARLVTWTVTLIWGRVGGASST
jgi:SAM-dependent methyltransferase